MKRLLCFLLPLLLLSGCAFQGQSLLDALYPLMTEPATAPSVSNSLPTQPPVLNGWQDVDGQRRFFVNNTPLTGWQSLDGQFYYFQEDGLLHTGFLEYEGHTYYFHPDGTMATGEVWLDGTAYHFTASGERIVLVNPWNTVPEDYTPNLVALSTSIAVDGMYVEESCYDALVAMLEECNRVCPYVCVVSSYRTQEYQTKLYENKVSRVMAQGYSEREARVLAAKEVALPGTSEHQLGLAVDVVDTRDWSLEAVQAELPAQQWLMENSWRFGFILRYPENKTHVTGIIYEPWHYRYVGKKLAEELFTAGLTLEEYLLSLTTVDAVG